MSFFRKLFRKKTRTRESPGEDGLVGLGWTLRTTSGDSVAVPCIDRIACEVASLSGHVHGSDGRALRGHWMEELFRNPSGREGHFLFFYQSVVDYFHGGKQNTRCKAL